MHLLFPPALYPESEPVTIPLSHTKSENDSMIILDNCYPSEKKGGGDEETDHNSLAGSVRDTRAGYRWLRNSSGRWRNADEE